MTVGELVRKIFGIAGTFVFLYVLRAVMNVFEFMPDFLFAVVSLMFIIADAVTVYNIVMSFRIALNGKKRPVTSCITHNSSSKDTFRVLNRAA